MSSANRDLVRSLYLAWDRGDFSSAEWADPEIESTFVGGPTPGHWSGLTGLAQTFADFASAREEFRIEADEFRALDEERVLVLSERICIRPSYERIESRE